MEKEIFDTDEDVWLTSVLDENPFAGGKQGSRLFLDRVIEQTYVRGQLRYNRKSNANDEQ